MSDEEAVQVGQLSSLKAIAAQAVASSGIPVSTSPVTGLDMGVGLESKAGQQGPEQMRRKFFVPSVPVCD